MQFESEVSECASLICSQRKRKTKGNVGFGYHYGRGGYQITQGDMLGCYTYGLPFTKLRRVTIRNVPSVS